MVCATIGMTTQGEAAKRKSPPSSFQLQGCAYWMPLCGTVMGSAPNIYVLTFGSVEHSDLGVRPEDGA